MADTAVAPSFSSKPRRNARAPFPLIDTFGSQALVPRVDLRAIVMSLAAHAYHGLEDKGSQMLSDHINDVRDAASDMYREKISREDFDYLRLLAEAHEVGEIKGRNKTVIWTRDRLLAYRHKKQPVPMDTVERILKLAKKKGQPYLNYIWDLSDDIHCLRAKRADLRVNRSPDREKLNPEETSATFKDKKAFLYQCADEYLDAVESGAIDRNVVTAFDFIMKTPHLAALLPHGAESLKPYWQDDYTPPAPQPGVVQRTLKAIDGIAGAVRSFAL